MYFYAHYVQSTVLIFSNPYELQIRKMTTKLDKEFDTLIVIQTIGLGWRSVPVGLLCAILVMVNGLHSPLAVRIIRSNIYENPGSTAEFKCKNCNL